MYPNVLPLDGPGQYILTSITFLITSNQATYLNRVEEILKKGVTLKGEDLTNDERQQIQGTYWCMFVGWWILTLAAFTCAVRVFLYHFKSSFWLLDIVIVLALVAGYFSLMCAAYRSWDWKPQG